MTTTTTLAATTTTTTTTTTLEVSCCPISLLNFLTKVKVKHTRKTPKGTKTFKKQCLSLETYKHNWGPELIFTGN